jgi:hypothetical protein
MSAASSFNFLKLNFERRVPIKIVEKSVMTDTLPEHAKLVHLFIQNVGASHSETSAHNGSSNAHWVARRLAANV